MLSRRSVCLVAASILCGSAIAIGAAATAPAPFLDILRGELNREFSILKNQDDSSAYYIAYEATADSVDEVRATSGAIITNTHADGRGVDATVRVGTAQFDNYHLYKGDRGRFSDHTPLSLDNNADQIRRALWSQTNAVYVAASQRLLQLKTDQQLISADSSKDADFSPGDSAQSKYVERPPELTVDRNAWAAKLRNWSGEFRKYPDVLVSQVVFRAQHEIRTFADSEGAGIEQGSNLLRIEISGEAIAPDGMSVGAFDSFEANAPGHLPSDAAVLEHIKTIAGKVTALAKAPAAEPIVAPAILSGRAAAVYFHEIFGHAIEGHRQKDVEQGQTFSNMIGKPVLPPFISVVFDPTRKEFGGYDLIGAYAYDDEGVKAEPVKVVDAGILKTFLMSRSPVGEFRHSNGHGRRQPGFDIVARQSNLIVESSNRMTDAQLRAKLLDEVQKQNKPYGLYFEEVASGYINTSRKGMQAFSVVPLVVYRVYADGRPDELIRGVDIVGTRLASFQKIIATSDVSSVFNGYCGAESGSIPVSAVSPAILVSEIEIQRKQNAQIKPPILPRPEAK